MEGVRKTKKVYNNDTKNINNALNPFRPRFFFWGSRGDPDFPYLMEQITTLGIHSFWVLCIVDIFSVIVVNFFLFF